MTGTIRVEAVRDPRPEDCDEVEALVNALDDGHFQQYVRWAAMDTEVAGARYRLYTAREDGALAASALVRLRRLGPTPLRIAEIPGGPIATSAAAHQALLGPLVEETAASGALALVAAPYLPAHREPARAAELAAAGIASPLPGPQPATLVVDLRREPEEILAGFRKTTRNLIRRARREESLQVKEAGSDADAATFQQLYDAMGEKGATPRPAPFFHELFRFLAGDPRRGFVLFARAAGQVLAGTVVLRHGTRAIYAFGASSRDEPALPKGHLIQFEAMCRARQDGAALYDLGGFTEGIGAEGERTPAQQINFWKSGLGGSPAPLFRPRQAILRPWLKRLEEVSRRLSAGWRRHGAPQPSSIKDP